MVIWKTHNKKKFREFFDTKKKQLNIDKIFNNKWTLHDQIPNSLADITRELEIKKYFF